MVAIVAAGPFGGAPAPKRMAGKTYMPHNYGMSNATITLTANRCYYVPCWNPATTTYAGLKFFNSGVGDNGKNVRTAAYAEASGGGPGSLLKDFGQVTLTGASAIRTASSSFTVTGPQWIYLALVADTTPVLFSMFTTSASEALATPYNALMGDLNGFGPGSANFSANTPVGDYVAMTYGAFASTATTPTNTVYGANAIPIMALYC